MNEEIQAVVGYLAIALAAWLAAFLLEKVLADKDLSSLKFLIPVLKGLTKALG